MTQSSMKVLLIQKEKQMGRIEVEYAYLLISSAGTSHSKLFLPYLLLMI